MANELKLQPVDGSFSLKEHIYGVLKASIMDLDIYDPARWRRRTHASPPERAAIGALLDLGLVDVTRDHLPGAGVFTWWSYRPGQFEANRGLRIDLALSTPDVAARTERVWSDVDERRDTDPDEKPSDHAPLVLDLRRARVHRSVDTHCVPPADA